MTGIICSICTEFLLQRDINVTTQCGHLFHQNCIEKWLNNSRTCPTCRQETVKQLLIRVHFEADENMSQLNIENLVEFNVNLEKQVIEANLIKTENQNLKIQLVQANQKISDANNEIEILKSQIMVGKEEYEKKIGILKDENDELKKIQLNHNALIRKQPKRRCKKQNEV